MKKFISALLALALVTVAVPAFAKGSGGGGGGSSASGSGGSGGSDTQTGPKKPITSPKQLHCKAGEVVKTIHKMGKPDKKVCVKASASNLSDYDLYMQGWLLAKTGEYDWAITVLSAVSNQNDPDVLTMLGYSNRKAGRVELGISYYDQALTQRPDFVRAREYLGEGFVAAGHMDLAKLQLEEIGKICGTKCDEYQDLQKVISGNASEAL